MSRKEAIQTNLEHWDEATEVHARGNVYGIDEFKAGICRLHRVETVELGDVRGRSLLHLQCHFGLDSLSWQRRGAHVTGVDLSPKAIALAKSLASELNLTSHFVCSDLYDLCRVLPGKGEFDIVFTSHGVLCWLPDLAQWAEIIAHFLKPGGTFYIVEVHPTARIFPTDSDMKPGIDPHRPMFSYFHSPEGTHWEPSPDYADPSHLVSGGHEWQHSLGDIINALIGAGLTLEFLHEFPFCGWKFMSDMIQVEKFSDSHGYWGRPASEPQLPLSFSIRARK